MSKREAELKSGLTKELTRQCPGFYILCYATAGAPDRTIIGAGRQTNWEMKHCTPDFVSHDNQALTCTRIAVSGVHCRYVLWQERNGVERTMVVHPRAILERAGWDVVPEAFCVGFDHRWLVGQIRKAHGV